MIVPATTRAPGLDLNLANETLTVLDDLAHIRRSLGAPAACVRATACLEAGLSYLQTELLPDAMRDLLARKLAECARRIAMNAHMRAQR